MPIRILVVDDDSTIRMLLRRVLEGRPEWQVCEAVNGRDAIEFIAEAAPDLVILDLSMPVMSGIQAAHEISQSQPSLPLLLITVQQVSDQLADLARKSGFRGAITKNNGREVVCAVEALLRNEVFFQQEAS
ncbi:MAG TPA: response regulator transcription factor [Terriglobales bacterium]|jgi:CheY-like chemotaxis protein|nr:response regulator transcription factor [Terriglobales bacterium]